MNSLSNGYATLASSTGNPTKMNPVLLPHESQVASTNQYMLSVYNKDDRDKGYTGKYNAITQVYAKCASNPYGPRKCS